MCEAYHIFESIFDPRTNESLEYLMAGTWNEWVCDYFVMEKQSNEM